MNTEADKKLELSLMIQRIYIDTSVVGGYFDEEFDRILEIRTPRGIIEL